MWGGMIIGMAILCMFLSSEIQGVLKVDNDLLVRHYARLSYHGNVDFLLSYPRSGNTLVRYIFEFVTGRPSMEMRIKNNELNSPLAFSFTELAIDPYRPPLWKVHRNRALIGQPFYDQKRARIVLLLRNYKELLFRESIAHATPLFDEKGRLIDKSITKLLSFWDADDTSYLYFKNIEFFETIDEEKRLLIRYEDLLQSPEDVIDKLVSFFNGSREKALELKQHYLHYAESVHTFYNVHETARSTDDDPHYYSRSHSYEECVQIDEWVRHHHPRLWSTYLQVYEESSFRDR